MKVLKNMGVALLIVWTIIATVYAFSLQKVVNNTDAYYDYQMQEKVNNIQKEVNNIQKSLDSINEILNTQ